jgi:hypothetical protein
MCESLMSMILRTWCTRTRVPVSARARRNSAEHAAFAAHAASITRYDAASHSAAIRASIAKQKTKKNKKTKKLRKKGKAN